jgi:hypothetical protein
MTYLLDHNSNQLAYTAWRTGLAIRGYDEAYIDHHFPINLKQQKELQSLYKNQLHPPYQGLTPDYIGKLAIQYPNKDHVFPVPYPWQDQAKIAVCFTYDVDLFDGLSYFPMRFAYWLYQSAQAFRHKQFQKGKSILQRARHWSQRWWTQDDPILGFHDLLDQTARYNLPADYFFLSVPRALSKEGRLYTFDDPRVLELFSALKKINAQVGLHASRYESQHVHGLYKQKVRLEKAWGSSIQAVRHHYLQAQFPQTWWDLIHAGFKISSNVGHHPPHQGFITQSAWPYRISDGNDSIWEIPMAVMDAGSALVGSKLYATVSTLLDSMRLTGGVLVLNFHPHYQITLESPYVSRQYEKILELILRGRDQGWLCTLYLSQIKKILSQRVQTLHS